MYDRFFSLNLSCRASGAAGQGHEAGGGEEEGGAGGGPAGGWEDGGHNSQGGAGQASWGPDKEPGAAGEYTAQEVLQSFTWESRDRKTVITHDASRIQHKHILAIWANTALPWGIILLPWDYFSLVAWEDPPRLFHTLEYWWFYWGQKKKGLFIIYILTFYELNL